MSDAIQVVNAENFDQVVLQSEKPVLVDFWASWCMPCKMLGPVFEEVAQENQDQAVFAKLNIDEATDIATRYQVMSIPTLILFKGGQVAEQSVGLVGKSEIEALLK